MDEPLKPPPWPAATAGATAAPASGEETSLGGGEAGEPARRSRWTTGLRYGVSALVLGPLALLVWATLAAGHGENLVAQIAKGEKPVAPAFTLGVLWPDPETWPKDATAALADGKLSLSELRGHPVVLNFWASWCVACKEEAPVLHRAARAHTGKVLFLGVDIQDLSGDARHFAAKYRINYVAVRDKTDGTYRAYGLTGVPETYYIDARGRIVAHAPGEVTRETLEQGIAAITGPGAGGTLPAGTHVKGP